MLAVKIKMVLAVALSKVGITEQGGSNRGQMVELFLKAVHLPPGEAWCCAFVSYCGFMALMDPVTKKSEWPLPMTGGCQYLGEKAQTQGMIVTVPQPGDVFLMYFSSKCRWAHTGFIAAVNSDGSCLTVEGNSNEAGAREGDRVLIRNRTFNVKAGDRFIRWVKGVSA